MDFDGIWKGSTTKDLSIKTIPRTEAKDAMNSRGPSLCLKMRWLQASAFDTKGGEYEWFHKQKEMGKDRKRFYL